MELLIMLAIILQGTGIALGMGGSTLAISNFFVAIADGTIDPGERKMMGVVYVVLKIALALIFVTTGYLILSALSTVDVASVATYLWAQLLVAFVLLLNSILMTKRIMPSTMGPGIQAGSWYTLGILTTVVGMLDINITMSMFLVWYVTALVVALLVVNGVMKYLKK
ncbi:MAG: hypothetical protein V4606_03740 [Patescibacteria group bacterium]